MVTCVAERPTEFAEVDVFMTECRYNENEHDIRKMKGLKVCSFMITKVESPSPHS